ncbi:hypothetical protein U9M48_003208, partial [Paspalum notatum var. saurae]
MVRLQIKGAGRLPATCGPARGSAARHRPPESFQRAPRPSAGLSLAGRCHAGLDSRQRHPTAVQAPGVHQSNNHQSGRGKQQAAARQQHLIIGSN